MWTPGDGNLVGLPQTAHPLLHFFLSAHSFLEQADPVSHLLLWYSGCCPFLALPVHFGATQLPNVSQRHALQWGTTWKCGYSSPCGCGDAGGAARMVFSGRGGSNRVGPTGVSSPHRKPRAHPAPVPVCAPAHAAASFAEQQGTPGQQGGGGWRRGVKPQWFHYTFVGQGLPKTSASPSLVKCPKREIRRSPTNVLAHGLLHAPPWCVKGPGGKLPSLFSPSALIAACPSSLHASLHRCSHVL